MPHEQAGGGAAARGNEALRAAAGAVKSDKRRGNIRDIRHKIKERAELPVCAMRHAPGALILAHRERWRRAPHFQGNTPDLAHREPWRRARRFQDRPPGLAHHEPWRHARRFQDRPPGLAHREPWRHAPHFQGNTPDLAHREPWRRARRFQDRPPGLAHREPWRRVYTPTQSKKTADGAPKRTVCRFLIQFDSLSAI